jgi:hypothetical protein
MIDRNPRRIEINHPRRFRRVISQRPGWSLPGQLATHSESPAHGGTHQPAHRRPALGWIRRTRRIRDVRPQDGPTALSSVITSASGRVTEPYCIGPLDTMNTDAPTASRKTRRDDVRLPWWPTIITSAANSVAQHARRTPSIELAVGGVAGDCRGPAGASPMKSTRVAPRSNRSTSVFSLKPECAAPSLQEML